MNRQLTSIIAGPEAALLLFGAVLFWFCSRHNSGTGRDVELMERLIWLLPFLITPIAFATIGVPGAKTWWWLGRAVVFTFIAMLICAGRLIEGLGSGSKGQDAAFILTIALGAVAVALATAVTGALILADAKPAFGQWWQAHRTFGSFLVLLSAVPIGVVLGITVTFCSAILLGLYCEIFKR